MRRDIRSEQGTALIVTIMATLLLSALGIGLLLTTTTETKITSNFTNSQEALYAADGAVERVMDDLLSIPDWNSILAGSTQSAFIDGPPGGTRQLFDSTVLDLTQATNVANCGKVSTCSDAEMNATSEERPWGANNPRWKLFAYGPMNEIVRTGTVHSNIYVVVWVGDDQAENDGDPTIDGVAATNPGRGVLALHAEAFGPRGTHKYIEVTVARTSSNEIERGYVGQRGQDEQNRRARKASVQTPGKAVTRQSLGISTGVIN